MQTNCSNNISATSISDRIRFFPDFVTKNWKGVQNVLEVNCQDSLQACSMETSFFHQLFCVYVRRVFIKDTDGGGGST